MITPEDWLYKHKDRVPVLEWIEKIQTEAWNEAIREANKNAKAKIVSVKSTYKENTYEKRCVVIESSILNLIKK